MRIERRAKPTLTPIELDPGDTLRFLRADGTPWELTLLGTSAEVIARGTLPYRCVHHPAGDVLAYAFTLRVRVNGRESDLCREVGTQAGFAAPVAIDGVRIWPDAAACIFAASGGFMEEKDWRQGLVCSPARAARLAVQDADLGIAPEPILPWHPGAERGISIGECYFGEDCWMGPYNGGSAHCGLDVNMPRGTPLRAPIACDDHYLARSTAAGYRCNVWRGHRAWADGSRWVLQSHHVDAMLVPERGSLAAGTPYATAAGTATGSHEHTHYVFRVIEQGGDYLLDPWLLFAAMRG